MFCPKCGKKIEDGVRFCVYCGYKINEENSAKRTNMNFYEILEITQDASPEVIKAAYKVLVKKLHPDNGNEKDSMGRTIEEVNSAYDTLSNPEKRKIYDEKLKYNDNKYDEEPKSNYESYTEREEQTQDNYEDSEESPGSLIAVSFAAFIAFIAFQYFEFSTWVLVITGLIIATSLGSFIGKTLTKKMKNIVKIPNLITCFQKEADSIEGCFELLLAEILFGYLKIDNWITKGFLLVLIVMIVSLLYSIIKALTEVDVEI